MFLGRIAGLIVTIVTAGCAGMDCAPAGDSPKPGASQESAPAGGPPRPGASRESAPAAGKPPVPAARGEPAPAKPAQPAPRQSAAAEAVTPPAKPEAAKPLAKAPAPADPAPKKEAAAAPAPAPKPAAAPLNLTLLEKKLKETPAIGVFTKLTLKNQVDALLEQFRAFYQGRIKTTLAQLRQPYDQLLLKVLSLLQDSDPPLAREILQSREAIWGILSDPDKFNNL